MPRRTIRADVERIGQVLAGIAFPAAKWQLIMYAEEYGADADTRAQLWSLTPGNYPSLTAVLGALGLVERLRRLRPRTGGSALPAVAGRRRPAR